MYKCGAQDRGQSGTTVLGVPICLHESNTFCFSIRFQQMKGFFFF